MFDFEALKTEEKSQAVKDYTGYQELLRSIARDECQLSKPEILQIIERADADVTQLETDVAWRRERDKMITELQQMPKYRAKLEALTTTLNQMHAELEKIKAEYEAKSNPIWWERKRLDDHICDVSYYGNELFESCREANLKVEYETLRDSWDNRAESNLYDRQHSLDSKITEARSNYHYHDRNITIESDEKKRFYKEQIKALEAEYEAIELKKIEVAQQKADHEAALEKIRQQMIFS
ncbi:hypothetical protein FACS18942_07130 [Planctomycetales bacterium]|nr:hypothetical protein FACS18942_07130 [Planctomycetales bacterium]